MALRLPPTKETSMTCPALVFSPRRYWSSFQPVSVSHKLKPGYWPTNLAAFGHWPLFSKKLFLDFASLDEKSLLAGSVGLISSWREFRTSPIAEPAAIQSKRPRLNARRTHVIVFVFTDTFSSMPSLKLSAPRT